MPLLDHFHAPWSERRHWHSFHNGWAASIAADINTRLPEGFFAEPNAQFGIEIDVATFDERLAVVAGATSMAGRWEPPEPILTIPFAMSTDVVEVLVYDSTAGPVLAGAIELISLSNKDRATHREPFVSKCAAYLQDGVGLIVVDIVTNRAENLHRALLNHFQAGDNPATDTTLYSSAYRPNLRDGETQLEVWQSPLALGQPLPVMPLGLKGGHCLPVDLESTYERTRREQRMANGA